MIEATLARVIHFDNLIGSGEPPEIQRGAFELLGALDELAQAGGPACDDAFKLAVLEKAGALVGIARRHDGAASTWLAAFEKGLREAAAMMAPTSAA